MEMYDVVVRFFQSGGPFMYPIAAVLILGLVISLERWLVLSSARVRNRSAFKKAMQHLVKRDYATLLKAGGESSVPMYKIVAAGIARFNSSRRRSDVESAMEEGVMEALPRLEKRTQYLATLANVATLLGLLGTIVGLIAAFSGWKDERNDPSNAVRLGDETALDKEAIKTMIAIADEITYPLAWEAGDAVIIDNTMVMHGRSPFQGKRKVLASLGNMHTHTFE